MNQLVSEAKAVERNGRRVLVGSLLERVSTVGHAFGMRGACLAADIAAALPNPPDHVVELKQVHGDRVLMVTPEWLAQRDRNQGKMFDLSYDAVICDRPGVLLAIRTADCAPILLHDPVDRSVAAIHAGWRGTLKNIAGATIAELKRSFRTNPRNLLALVGPSARECCYEVDGPVLKALRDQRDDWDRFVDCVDSRPDVDRANLALARLNASQLAEAGLDEDRISTINACTICRPDWFSSFRREGNRMQNMVSGIVLTGG